ncbi:hypothetical protein [Paenibacillus sp. FSL W8-0194]|uniref:hypothetical protein n=1 Tax=Paenibacillus sp. FSL W8-0194 TaxID=2921711 RepID=UPI0030DBC2D6
MLTISRGNTKTMGGNAKMKKTNQEVEKLVQQILKTAHDVGLKVRKKPQKKDGTNASSQ